MKLTGNRAACVRFGENRKQDAGAEEAGSENRRTAGQQVGRTARGHETATSAAAATNAKSAAFAPLQQNDNDKGQSDHQMND